MKTSNDVSALSKLEEKEKRFVLEYLVDLNGTQAAIRAKYSEVSARQLASRMLSKDDIQDAIAEEREKIAKRNAITIDDLIKELEEARTVALTAESPQSSAAVAATMGKAKILGFLTDKVDNVSSDGSMSPVKVERTIVDPKNDTTDKYS